ncbi:RSP_7527 family protein [Pararhodobacter sp.]
MKTVIHTARDLAEIEREARALRARVIGDFLRALGRGLVARLHLGGAARTA